MKMTRTKDKVVEAKPYVERALKDDELRDALVSAFAAARQVYNDLLGDRGATGIVSRVATDEDIQDNLKRAVEELRHAADRVQGKDEHTGRNTALLLTGITLGILFNPVTGKQTREWLKDRIFGPGEEFDYTTGDGGTNTPAAA
jgi:hypothetical protein